MTSEEFERRYGDSPALLQSWLLGSIQIVVWLLFHPSAWRSHIERLAPDLPEDFCLLQLRHHHVANRDLRRLVMHVCLAVPAIGATAVVTAELAMRSPSDALVGSAVVAVVMGIASALITALTVSVSAGTFAGTVGALCGGFVTLQHCEFLPTGPEAGVLLFWLGVLSSVVGAQGTGHSPIARTRSGRAVGVVLRLIGAAAIFGATVSVLGSVADLVGGPPREASRLRAADTLGAALRVHLFPGSIVVLLARLHQLTWRASLAAGVMYALCFAIAFRLQSAIYLEAALDGCEQAPVSNMLWLATLLVGVSNLSGVPVLALLLFLSRRFGVARAGSFAVVVLAALVWLSIAHQFESKGAASIAVGALLAGQLYRFWLPAVLYPVTAAWDYVLLRLDREAPVPLTRLPWHSAFWDEHQRLPPWGLHRHLVTVAGSEPELAASVMAHLAASRHRSAVQLAQRELDARMLEKCESVEACGAAIRRIGSCENGVAAPAGLRAFRRIGEDLAAAVAQSTRYAQRLALAAVVDRLEALARDLVRSRDAYAPRLLPAAEHWRLVIVDRIRNLEKETELRNEIDCPYVLGVPLAAHQEIFVGRTDVCARLEKLLVDERRPPILLYGQRRMGKTSLMNNLGRILPRSIIPMFVDFQGPVTHANGHANLLFGIARAMRESAQKQRQLTLPSLSRELLAQDPFTQFEGWLADIEDEIPESSFLLLFDEFEALEEAIVAGRYDASAVMGLLRHVIQHRPRYKMVLAGSHAVEELANYASFLINVQVVELSYLTSDEARRLIECPTKDFVLRYEPDASRHVIDLTRCHPYLVQLLCSEIVAIKNEQAPARRRLVSRDDVDVAVPEALEHGSMFFFDLERQQIAAPEADLLRTLARRGADCYVDRSAIMRMDLANPDQSLRLLLRRRILEETQHGLRFQIELVRRWFSNTQAMGR